MKRLMTICIMLTAIALIVAPAFAEVQNVKVSGDVNSAGVYRSNYDLLSTNQTANGDLEDTNFLYTQARVAIDADLTDSVSATVRLLSEYDWGSRPSTAEDQNMEINLANVILKEVFYAPLTITVGRQELKYGTGFVVGDPDTNGSNGDANNNLSAADLSLDKSFDAVKAVLDYDPLVVDIIYAKIDEDSARLTGSPTTDESDDEDLYGINAAYDLGTMDSEIEAYLFVKRENDDTAATGTAGELIYTYGIRSSVTPIEGLNLLGEAAWQTGDYSTTRDQDALAYQIAGDYTCADVTIPWVDVTIGAPMIKAGWTHYSGEETGNSGDQKTWLPLYEDQTHGMIANYILTGVNGGQNSNADILNVGGSISPIEDISLSIDFYKFWLDEKLVNETNQQASQFSALVWNNLTETAYYMKADDDLGYEIDLGLKYDYTEDVKMGLNAGWFKPGDAFDGASGANSNDETAVQLLATLDVAF